MQQVFKKLDVPKHVFTVSRENGNHIHLYCTVVNMSQEDT